MAYQGNRPPQRNNQPPPASDLSFLNNGLTEGDVIKISLLSRYSRELGRTFARGDQRDKVSGGQMRKFYGEVREIFEASHNDKELKAEHIAELTMLSSKAAYGVGRRVVSRRFQQLIDKCVENTKTVADLKAFKQFMEAIVGYYYGEGGGGK